MATVATRVSGQILYTKDGKWGVTDMGHCSCYGPVEGITEPKQTLEEIEENCSEEAGAEIKALVEAAKGVPSGQR